MSRADANQCFLRRGWVPSRDGKDFFFFSGKTIQQNETQQFFSLLCYVSFYCRSEFIYISTLLKRCFTVPFCFLSVRLLFSSFVFFSSKIFFIFSSAFSPNLFFFCRSPLLSTQPPPSACQKVSGAWRKGQRLSAVFCLWYLPELNLRNQVLTRPTMLLLWVPEHRDTRQRHDLFQCTPPILPPYSYHLLLLLLPHQQEGKKANHLLKKSCIQHHIYYITTYNCLTNNNTETL